MQDTVITKDGIALPLNIQHAIMVKTAQGADDLFALMRDAKREGLSVTPFTKEMLETTNDKKVLALTKEQNAEDVEYCGILVFGKKQVVDELTSGFALHS